jgi:hypothetical protein
VVINPLSAFGGKFEPFQIFPDLFTMSQHSELARKMAAQTGPKHIRQTNPSPKQPKKTTFNHS